MSLALKHQPTLTDRLHNAAQVTADLMADIIAETCRRAPNPRLQRLITSAAWTDAALELIAYELPRWQLRRIAYDEGEWHCALSRQRELPDWLDPSIEACHTDLALALLSVFVEARAIIPPMTSVPDVPRAANPLYEPVVCDNFG